MVPPLNAPQPSELTTEKLLKQALVAPPEAAPTPAATPSGGKKKKKPEPNVLTLMGQFILEIFCFILIVMTEITGSFVGLASCLTTGSK